jgi:hypothetical protein
MNSAALEREYLDALGRTRPSDLAALRDAGVDEGGFALSPGVAAIRISERRFELDPDGDAVAFILPVRVYHPFSPEAPDPVRFVREGDVVDLLAFSPAVPFRWALRTGAAAWIGCIEPQYLMPDPVPVWRTPLGWLRSGSRGLVLLTQDRREQYRVLTLCDALIAEDERHAARLREVVQRPLLGPPVLVRPVCKMRNGA